MISRPLVRLLRGRFVLDWRGIHGAPHWARVRENGIRLAEETGADVRIVELFAFLHDSCRLNDDHDPAHGHRAAEFARSLVGIHIDLDPQDLDLLVTACVGHSHGFLDGDITVRTCWDADRLDLGRVGIRPHADRLCTDAARDPMLIEWAYGRSIR